MCLMDGRKLLYARVVNGQQTFFSVDFWVSFLFTFVYILGVKKQSCLTSFCRKNDSQCDRKKELDAMGEEMEWFLYVVSLA